MRPGGIVIKQHDYCADCVIQGGILFWRLQKRLISLIHRSGPKNYREWIRELVTLVNE
jgi:dissimilatory sulfite reductase (desulfoviridin) alpha/beta subunit